MRGSEPPDSVTQRRLDRERKARREAEAIAERVTGELYAAVGELERVNRSLEKANQDLASANEAIKEFVAIASHDIRGPLTVMLGSAELLLAHGDQLDAEETRDLLGRIEHQGQSLRRLVGDLLTVSRLEADAVELHIEEISIAMELERVVHEMGDDAVGVRVQAPKDLTVSADPDHLERILMNYLSNAVKYGEPPIDAEADDSGDFVEVRIRDRGSGVPAEFVHRLFGKFARADEAASRQRGTGLGLSIVRGLARANGGEAWYEPNSPRGSCFAVKLPKVAK